MKLSFTFVCLFFFFAFFYLKNLNLLVLKYFLAYLGSSVKTTSILKCSVYIKLKDS